MIYFGFISSLFDFATILPLLFIWKASPEVFRTAWFIESSLSEMLITFAIRTRLPFYRSQPSRWLILLSVLSALLVIALPHFLPYSSMFGFSPLPLSIAVWTGLVLIAYFVTTEIFKGLFYKRFSD
jgi:Mg2+-importing ATPase